MYQIVKVKFPFADNIEKDKPRPALVVTPSFGKYNQLVVAYITAKLDEKLETDLVIDIEDKDFYLTGLRGTSLVKLHRLITVTPSQLGIVGTLPNERIPEVKEKLLKVFQLK
jgi:mRNA-degrading endonuclease toxin of MazEF toxin-antitoxin module